MSRCNHHHLAQCLLTLALLVVTVPTSVLLVSSRWSPTWVSLSTTGADVVLVGLVELILSGIYYRGWPLVFLGGREHLEGGGGGKAVVSPVDCCYSWAWITDDGDDDGDWNQSRRRCCFVVVARLLGTTKRKKSRPPRLWLLSDY